MLRVAGLWRLHAASACSFSDAEMYFAWRMSVVACAAGPPAAVDGILTVAEPVGFLLCRFCGSGHNGPYTWIARSLGAQPC